LFKLSIQFSGTVSIGKSTPLSAIHSSILLIYCFFPCSSRCLIASGRFSLIISSAVFFAKSLFQLNNSRESSSHSLSHSFISVFSVVAVSISTTLSHPRLVEFSILSVSSPSVPSVTNSDLEDSFLISST